MFWKPAWVWWTCFLKRTQKFWRCQDESEFRESASPMWPWLSSEKIVFKSERFQIKSRWIRRGWVQTRLKMKLWEMRREKELHLSRLMKRRVVKAWDWFLFMVLPLISGSWQPLYKFDDLCWSCLFSFDTNRGGKRRKRRTRKESSSLWPSPCLSIIRRTNRQLQQIKRRRDNRERKKCDNSEEEE